MGYWKMIKEYARAHLIAVWAVFSILFAIIIHFLFHWDSGPKWLEAKWNAGDILAYTSTVALGLLALWQNKRFKEENDVSQKRLEKLTEQANSLTVVNKIIETETDKLRRLTAAIDAFAEACDPTPIIGLLSPFPKTELEKRNTAFAAFSSKEKIKNSLNVLLLELGVSGTESIDELSPFPYMVITFNNASSRLIDLLLDSLGYLTKSSARPDDNLEEELKEQCSITYLIQRQFTEERSSYIHQREALINKILYGDYSVDEIRQMLNQDSAV